MNAETIGLIALFIFAVSLVCRFVELAANHPLAFVLFIVLLSTYRPKKMKVIQL